MTRPHRVAAALLLWAGCSSRTQIAVHYTMDAATLADTVRVATLIDVDSASDARVFYADAPYHEVATGVGYEVRDFNGTGRRQVLITHDSTLGYKFGPAFTFTLLPPPGEPAPPLVLNARADGTSGAIGGSPQAASHFASGAQVTLAIVDQRCGGQVCAAGSACCNGACVDVTDSADHCGGCTACGALGDSCSGAACRCQGGSSCSAAQTCCPGIGCVDVMKDPFDCGACGQRCNPGEQCSGGACRCGANAGCAAGVLCCGDGSCSTTGSCACGSAQCQAPAVCCDAANSLCVDLTTDNDCGACGHACAAPLACAQGQCTCAGTVCAAGDACCASGCRNLQNDPANCGGCGVACSDGQACVAGQCVCGAAPCPAGALCCAGICADPMTSSLHCGGCDGACQMGESCAGGQCSCNGAQCQPGESCCADGCFALSTSNLHCGACGAPGCPAGQACQMGGCVPTTCDPSCVQHGNLCNGTVCSCNGTAACDGSNTCCPPSANAPGGCKALGSDPANCGSCGHGCRPGETCNGACRCNGSGGCANTQSCCASGCANLNNDNANCGTCGLPCSPGTACSNGTCKKVEGQPCGGGGECRSGVCADGVCCAHGCQAACTSCALPMQEGKCTTVPPGTPDPHGVCTASDPKSCGLDGTCQGTSCAFWTRGTRCGSVNCEGDLLRGLLCDGMGQCKTDSIDCKPYTCVPAGVPGLAACTSGPCTFQPSGIDLCSTLNICSPACKCVIVNPDACGNSACGC